MKLEELKKALREGEVSFKFKKKDGTIREARGTTNSDLIPHKEEKEDEVGSPKRKHTPNPNVTCYFDLDKMLWRSFTNDSLIED